MRVLVLYDRAQRVTQAFRARGHEAYSCNLKQCDGLRTDWHILCADVLTVVDGRCAFYTADGEYHLIDTQWDLLICLFPGQPYSNRKAKALCKVPGEHRSRAVWLSQHFNAIVNAKAKHIAVIAVDPPYGIPAIPHHNQLIQSLRFGSSHERKVYAWLVRLPPLDCGGKKEAHRRDTFWDSCRPLGFRAKRLGRLRAADNFVPPEVVEEMATQWGEYAETVLRLRDLL